MTTTSSDVSPVPRPTLTSFTVDIVSHDNHSLISLSQNTVEALNIDANRVVLVENTTKRRAVPFIVQIGDHNQDDNVVKMNTVAGANLRIQNRDQVAISRLSTLTSAIKVAVSPINSTFNGQSKGLLDSSLSTYFSGQSRPLGVGDQFVLRHAAGQRLEFCVTSVLPAPYSIVTDSTIIHTDGKPISHTEAEAWYTKASVPDTTLIRELYRQSNTPEGLPELYIPTEDSSGSRSQLLTPPPDFKNGQTASQPSGKVLQPPRTPESPGLPSLQAVQTLPEIYKQPTSSSVSSGSSGGLYQTHSLTVVRDFAPNVVLTKEECRKRQAKKITFRSLFMPHTLNPAYHMDLVE